MWPGARDLELAWPFTARGLSQPPVGPGVMRVAGVSHAVWLRAPSMEEANVEVARARDGWRRRMRRLVVIASSWLVLPHAFASAEPKGRERSRWSMGAEAEAATMVSRDQLGRMAYDRVGVLGRLDLGYAPVRWLDVHAALLGGGFLSSRKPTGGLVAPMLGARLCGTRGGLVPYLLLDAGPAYTGVLLRPFFRVGVGVDVPVARSWTLGPVLGYAQLVQWNDAGSSTDARYLWAGLGIRRRHEEPPPNPPRSERERVERVLVIERTPPEPPAAPASTELHDLLERALPSPPASKTQVELLAPVLFAFDSDELEPVGVAMLHEVAQQLTRRKDIALVAIQGYADSRGSSAYNRALSERRARRVLEWLVEHGVERERLTIEAEGATGFIESGETERAHEQNRRVIFRVLEVVEP